MLIYLHGFRSTPNSLKARILAAHLLHLGRLAEWQCPALSVSPAAAIREIGTLLEGCDPQAVCLIGSSLGGYYATFLAERFGCRAVLLNPAVTPQHDLEKYLGEQTVWGTEERIVVHPHYLVELERLWIEKISRPERYFLVAATGDEVIDWRHMVAKYPGAKQHIIEGGDHGLSEFADVVDEVLAFADARAS